MPGWHTAPVNGVWRLGNAGYCGHRLTVYRSRSGAYRAYLSMAACWVCGAANRLRWRRLRRLHSHAT